MPKRLLLAAEILRDVARTVNAADRPLLESAADELEERAAELLLELETCDEPVAPALPGGRPHAGAGMRQEAAAMVH